MAPDRLHDDVWRNVRRRRLVEWAGVGRITVEELLDEVCRLEAEFHPDRRQAKHEVGPDPRLEALARMVAIAADRRSDVIAFRRECLAGRLLKPDEVPAWLRHQQQEDGEPSVWLTLSVPIGPRQGLVDAIATDTPGTPAEKLTALADEVRRGGSDEPIPGVSARRIELPLPHEWQAAFGPALFVRTDGVLGRLKRLAETLAGTGSVLTKYSGLNWPSEESAVDYLLTGRPPRFPMASAACSIEDLGFGEPRNSSPPALTKVHLDVNWRMSSGEVRNLYSQLRSRLWHGRAEAMTDKHLELAVFIEQHRAAGLTWPALRARWNKKHPRWRFPVEDDRVANRFARDCRSAWSRVTGARWPVKMKEEP